MASFNLSIPGKLKREARARAALEDVTLSDVINAFLKQWLHGELPTPVEPRPDPDEPRAGEQDSGGE